jgi:hypothetical protein
MDNGDWGDTDSDGEAGIPHAAAAASVLDAWLADHHGANKLSLLVHLLHNRLHLFAAGLLVSFVPCVATVIKLSGGAHVITPALFSCLCVLCCGYSAHGPGVWRWRWSV